MKASNCLPLLILIIPAQSATPSGPPTLLQDCQPDLLFSIYFNTSYQYYENYWQSTGAPSCWYSQDATPCEALYSSIADCGFEANSQGCFCLAVAQNSCPFLCRQGPDASLFIRWILDEYCFGPKLATQKTCENQSITPYSSPSLFQPPLNISVEEYKTIWKDYDDLETSAHDNLFARQWTVTYNSTEISDARPTYKCPTAKEQLGSFAIVNGITLVASLILGHRWVIKSLTCMMCGSRESSTSWWLLSGAGSAALSITGNALNAGLIKRTPGFENISVSNLILLWSARPRLAWTGALLAAVGAEDSYYTSLGASCTIAEGILQTMASFYIGKTAHWAWIYGYLKKGRLDDIPGAHNAKMMYAGVLFWLITIAFAFIVWLVLLCYTTCSRKTEGHRTIIVFGVCFTITMILPLVGQWLFWAGFIGLAGDRLVLFLAQRRTATRIELGIVHGI
ncbi:hypothetical protein JMJ35_003759 [Cladonia borealis]|uniref:Uncharacterized protein n=1 Tax=Cladonia borealis TaxID=184061 RepID=A0AA39R356_9LECA|nr:hypothetical protein JMJ35_003759 [Cladonia borealis]